MANTPPDPHLTHDLGCVLCAVAVNIFVDIVLVVDVLVSFRTCHITPERQLLLDIIENRKAYLKSWFVPDLISTVPYDLVVPVRLAARNGLPLGRTLDVFAKLLRLTRFVRLLKLANHIEYARVLRITLLVSFLVLWTHWLACAQYALSNVELDEEGGAIDVLMGSRADDDGGDGGGTAPSLLVGARGVSWVVRLGLHRESFPMRYLAAFYYAVTMSAKSPWLAPSPPAEFVFGCVAVVVCSVLYAAFVGSITAVFTSYDAHLGRQRDALNLVRAFSRYRGLSKPTQRRLVRNYEAYWHETNGIDTQKFLRTMVPKHLLQDVLRELYAPVLFTMPALTNSDALSADGLFAFLSGLRTQVLLSGDVLWRYGQFPSTIYILMHGSVQLLLVKTPGRNSAPDAAHALADASIGASTNAPSAKSAKYRRKQSTATSFRHVSRSMDETHAALYKVERPGSVLGFQVLYRSLEPMPFGARADQRSTCYSIDRSQLLELVRTYDHEGTFQLILANAAREAILRCRQLVDSAPQIEDQVLSEWADFCSERADDDGRQSMAQRTTAAGAGSFSSDGSFKGKPGASIAELSEQMAALQAQMSELLSRIPATTQSASPSPTSLGTRSARRSGEGGRSSPLSPASAGSAIFNAASADGGRRANHAEMHA